MNGSNRNQGIASVLSMMFLVIFGSLAAAMALVSNSNLQTSAAHQRSNRALAAAETGLQFATRRVGDMAAQISTAKGSIDDEFAQEVWQEIRANLVQAMTGDAHAAATPTVNDETGALVVGPIRTGPNAGDPTFGLTLTQHPIPGENYASAYYQRSPYNVGGAANVFTADGEAVSADNAIGPQWIRIRVVGMDQGFERSIQMDYRIDKKVRFAILSRNRIMIGRNVMIRGTIGSKYTLTNFTNGHPVQIRNNFHGLDAGLDAKLIDLRDYLRDNDIDGDNRIKVADAVESGAVVDAAFVDRNGDGYIDHYDLFIGQFDQNEDGALEAAEFTNGAGGLLDQELWQLINEMKYPAGTEFNWVDQQIKIPGGAWEDASDDMSAIDNSDGYAKIIGAILLQTSKAAWEAGAGGGDYRQFLEGVISNDPSQAALTFEANQSQLADFSSANFDTSSYRSMATGLLADQVASPVANVAGQPTAYVPANQGAIESVPFNSPHPYDYYQRPVYRNMTFTNVTIPRGNNALFDNCKFIGVTFIDTEVNNADPSFNYAGMQEANGSLKYLSISADVNGSPVQDTKAISNNVRFNNCVFEGVVATESPVAFAHVRNKVQFTGATKFDLNAPSLSAAQKALFKKSTILAPQYSIDIGTFTDPTNAGEVLQIDGAVVAGVLDVRGKAYIDGSVITTFDPVPGAGPLAAGGNPAQFNTTIGYFESAAGDGEGELPGVGRGKIIIRYDPSRALPDGITGSLEFRANLQTYHEGL